MFGKFKKLMNLKRWRLKFDHTKYLQIISRFRYGHTLYVLHVRHFILN